MSGILFSNQKVSTTIEASGGKGFHLCNLVRYGFNVPKFCILETSFCRMLPSDNKWLQSVEHYFSDAESFAVRSSAAEEDAQDASYAGQFESYLFVKKEELRTHIQKVIDSANSERVVAYRKRLGKEDPVKIAVIVQQMINSDVSGVAFGLNPLTGNRKEKVVNALWGLGEGLVSAELNSDQYIIKTEKTEYSEITASKTEGIFFNISGSGTARMSITPDKQNQSCLDKNDLGEISEVLDRLYSLTGTYQDIEFAYHNKIFYLLQARPITTHFNLSDKSGEMILWDNSNIIESYPGLTSPLTFSFILKMYESVYEQFALLLGVEKKIVAEEQETFANMLGLLNGRVYYNLLSWYKALALVPGYSLNASFMEKMMGVKETFVLREKRSYSRWQEYRRIFGTVKSILYNHFTIKKQRDAFLKHLNKTIREYQDMDFDSMNPEEIMRAYLDFEKTLVEKWKAPLVNDFFAMIYFGTLQKLVLKYKLDEEGGTLHNNLLAGSNDIVSTEPIRLGMEMSESILANKDWKAIFITEDENSILLRLEQNEFPELKQKLDSFLLYWGERCVGELKLETVTYSLNPASYIRILKSYVTQGMNTSAFNNVYATELRTSAESVVKQKLKGFFRRRLFYYVLGKTRYLVSNRENLRYERTRGFGMVRKLFHALGKRWKADGVLDSERDIFWLTQEEIFSFIKGTSINTDLKPLIEFRKKQYKEYERRPTAERIATYGTVYQGNDFSKKKEKEITEGDLSGIPCCAGIVKAKVRIVHSPDEVQSLDGAILVTSSTDPGWAPLFPGCSGILVERGSLLSHSAIVSRELGIPCIVGITGLLEKLKDGQEVEMDGSTGKIIVSS